MAALLREYRTGRLFEWFAAAAMISIGLKLTFSPHPVDLAVLDVVAHFGIDAEIVRIGFFFGGIARWFALIANGQWPGIGPIMRAIGAIGGAVTWAAIASVPSFVPGTPGGIVVAICWCMCICEIYCSYRSLAHGRWRR